MNAKQSAIAVFDWDNTVRDGFTILDWFDYLKSCEHEYLRARKNKIFEAIDLSDRCSKQYNNGEITHDEYAISINSYYCEAIKGWSASQLAKIADDFIPLFKKKIYKYAIESFSHFNNINVPIYIVTGAPALIVGKCKEEFGIKSIFSLVPEVEDDIFTGNIIENCGYSKEKNRVMDEIKASYTCNIFGFGDSVSDLPILDKSDYPFIIGKNDIGDRGFPRIDPILCFSDLKRLYPDVFNITIYS